jgi:hypothetical protein
MAARSAFSARRMDFLRSKEPARIRIDQPDGPAPGAAPPQTQSQPGGTNLVDGDKPKPAAVSVSLSDIAAAANPGAKREPSIVDFWIEGRYEPYETAAGENDGSLGMVYVGSKYKLGPDILVGGLAQFDHAEEKAGWTDVSSGGWMAGPFMSVRFGPGVIFDGRVAWGAYESGVAGVSLESDTGNRRLLSGKLRGARQVGSWTLAPSVGLSYVEEKATATRESEPAATAPPQGRIEVLPELKRRFDVGGDTYVEPRAAVGAFYSFDDISKMAPAPGAPLDDIHAKAEAGVAVGVKDGVNVEAKGGVETGAKSEPDNWTGRLQLNMPLGK